MQNPYEVLGIREGASKEQIKAAYKEQVKKYHPDKHQDNPLYDLAEEKLQEINEAYESLMKGDAPGNTWQAKSQAGKPGPEYQTIRMDLDRGSLSSAENRLNQINNRGAEWHFLYGVLSLRKGWYDEAVNSLQTAVQMDPGNMEYRNAMNSLQQRTGGYRTSAYNRGYGNGNDEFCRMLQCYCCADALCDCI